MSDKLFERIALIGIGLIGSSLARVLRRDAPDTKIAACARRVETLQTVRRLNLADLVTDDPAEAAHRFQRFRAAGAGDDARLRAVAPQHPRQ